VPRAVCMLSNTTAIGALSFSSGSVPQRFSF
jgi:hypothetical protein